MIELLCVIVTCGRGRTQDGISVLRGVSEVTFVYFGCYIVYPNMI
jgi:hypothetical protein